MTRGRIGDRTRRIGTFSKRAAGVSGHGVLNVVREGFKCPSCGNDKALQNTMGKKCSRYPDCTYRKYRGGD